MGHTTQLHGWLDLERRSDIEQSDTFMEKACDRLLRLAHAMRRGYQRVRRWCETDDVLQSACCGSTGRELLDLAKHYYGAEGVGLNHNSDARQGGGGQA